ncbi:sucrose synthase [Tanacetum coccineum]
MSAEVQRCGFKDTHVRLWNIRSVTLVRLSNPAICCIGPGPVCVYYELSPVQSNCIVSLMNRDGKGIMKPRQVMTEFEAICKEDQTKLHEDGAFYEVLKCTHKAIVLPPWVALIKTICF